MCICCDECRLKSHITAEIYDVIVCLFVCLLHKMYSVISLRDLKMFCAVRYCQKIFGMFLQCSFILKCIN